MRGLALCLLAVLVARHYAWDIAPAELAGVASKMLGALEALFLLVLVALAFQHRAVWAVVAYGVWEHSQTAICSAAYMARPWPIQPGQPMCSSGIGFELGALGILAAATLLAWLNLSTLTVFSNSRGQENE